MKKNAVSGLSFLLILALGIAGAYAAYGPCVPFVSASHGNTGYCVAGVCHGSVINRLPQSLCAGLNPESSCTDTPQAYYVRYGLKAEGGIVGCIGVSCVQDLSTRTEVPGGNTCG